MDQNYYMQKIIELNKIVVLAEADVKKAPEGRLKIIHCKSTTQYYWNNQFHGGKNKYIKQANITLACQLAQKSYANKVILLAKTTIKQSFMVRFTVINPICSIHLL